MKKANLVMGFMMLFAGSMFGQTPIKQTKKLDDVQVPMAVKQAFQQNFGDIPEDGYWMVNVVRTQYGGRTVTTPQWYSFNKRTKPERIEVRFTPEGELLLAKGLTSKEHGTIEEPVMDEKKKIG